MMARYDANMEKEKLRQSIFGVTSTIMYLFFQFMHVSLAISAYNIGEMNMLSQSITASLFPDIDVDDFLAPKQFYSINDLNRYMMEDVNSMFMDASSALEEKGLFFSKNHLFPFMRFTTQRGQERECGSITSNNKAREEAHKNNENHETG